MYYVAMTCSGTVFGSASMHCDAFPNCDQMEGVIAKRYNNNTTVGFQNIQEISKEDYESWTGKKVSFG